MPSLRRQFLDNRARLIEQGFDEEGSCVEEGRKRNFGSRLPDWTAACREAADRAAGAPQPDCAAPESTYVLKELAAALAATGEERYAVTARSFCRAWVPAHPPDSFRPGSGSCGLAHALYPWLATLHVFLTSDLFDEALVEAIIGSARDQLNHIAAYPYPARNLRITTASSLLLNGLRLAFLPEGPGWVAKGAHLMGDACMRQILPDGSHWEAVPHYTYCTMGDILSADHAARLLPEVRWDVPAERVAGLFDYLAAATRPTGWIAGMHDGPCEPTDRAKGRGVIDTLEDRAAHRRLWALPARDLPTEQVFPDAGQVFLRDSWRSDATWISFDVAPCRSYHWHPCRNSVQLEAHGRLLLADPGRFSYADPVWGGYAMSTPAHSTLNLNGWNQCEAPAQLRHRHVAGYDVVEGYYAGGYWEGNLRGNDHGRGVYAEHHRTLLWVRGRCVVVIDNLFNASPAEAKPTLESVWQLSEGPVRVDGAAGTAVTGHGDANLLMLFALRPERSALFVREGEVEPPRGWVVRQFEEEYAPAPQICLTAEGHDPWHTDLATVLVPFAGAQAPQVEVTGALDPGASADIARPCPGMLSLRWGDGSTDHIWWTRRLESALDEQSGFTTDAALVHLQRDASGRLTGGVAVDGTFVDPYAPRHRGESATFGIGQPEA